MSYSKHELNQRVIDQLPPKDSITLEKAIATWWKNPLHYGGLRLTYLGYKVFKQYLDIEIYSFDIKDPKITITNRMLVDLDKLVTTPYYLDLTTGEFFLLGDSKQLMMLSLYGNISAWVNSLKS
jgi:hypothetical protein